ncbi:hypothetical protein [Polyangium aurulentum]|uniref:hypothetical protein n=1 Tax=Polyangium aurulentum TaxID=2567896 RepID=UPI0010AE5A97|nr:hypothetical protein [Polyangium aurulentum]UQA61197.1 hypothetical protein E8A73_012240 [Polyangium aurulentum]
MHRRNDSVILLPLLISIAACGDTSSALPGGDEIIVEDAVLESEDELSGCNVDVLPEKEMVITHPGVVEDPARTTGKGAWTFARLMENLAGGQDARKFVLTWLETWKTPQILDRFVIPHRPKMSELVIEPWKARSGNEGLDLEKAPFRLLAITNRVDLAEANGQAGEGRIIFGVVDKDGGALPFTVIFEYKLLSRGGMRAQEWARQWHALSDLPLGSPEYNAKLQALTDKFTTASALAQLRTNEIALEKPWELREFHLRNGRLAPAAMELTPDLSFNGTQVLAKFIDRNRNKIDGETHAVRSRFQGDPYQAASALAPNPSFQWDAPGVAPELRLKFSRSTCNGCHTGDTGTTFLHIAPRQQGQPAQLSNFLANVDIPRRVTNMKKLLCR